jgi:hypothetical protein
LTPEEETDALLDALGRGEAHADGACFPHPGHSGGRDDRAVRLLAALVRDVLDGGIDDTCQRHSVMSGDGR